MKIIEQLIIKKLDKSNEAILNYNIDKKQNSPIWDFYCAYQLSRAYLGINDEKRFLRIKLWRMFINKQTDEFSYRTFLRLMQEDFEIILMALEKMIKEAEEHPELMMGELRKKWLSTVAILSYEYQ